MQQLPELPAQRLQLDHKLKVWKVSITFLYWQSFAFPHGKVLRDLARHKHVAKPYTLSHSDKGREPQQLIPLSNLAPAVSKLGFSLPPSYSQQAAVPQCVPMTGPEQRNPGDHSAPAPVPERDRAWQLGRDLLQGPVLLQCCSADTKGSSLFQKVCRTFP